VPILLVLALALVFGLLSLFSLPPCSPRIAGSFFWTLGISWARRGGLGVCSFAHT